MTITNAILLGLLQALGEFLPISSSAHLVLLPYLRGQVYQGVAFDVILHAGTLLAVLLYFWRDWWVLIKQGLTAPKSREGRMLWYLAAATIPAAILGFLFEDLAENTFRSPALIAINLMIFAAVLFWADKKAKAESNPLFDVPFMTVFLIGCAQALALMPGVSRSGITITAALFLGLSRSTSARISFLLSAPIIAGATVLKITQLTPADLNGALLAGFASAFLGAVLVIGWLMKYIKSHTFNVFVYYRWILGAVILAVYFWR
ncbi:undecaprenyl-diphosphate phosphatase [Candidatus Avelusimicrobium luingense]|uniref:undecaprenyl-diphosphate phosphatase n=1 Tax=Candidatus Avelusimicrobium luingense TaxID=3416211 RepID=UPI003D1109F1